MLRNSRSHGLCDSRGVLTEFLNDVLQANIEASDIFSALCGICSTGTKLNEELIICDVSNLR